MGSSAQSLIVIFISILLEYHETSAGVTLLVESPGPAKNTSTLLEKVGEANLNEIQRTKERLVLTKDKDAREAWRTERGDLIKIQYLNGDPAKQQELSERASIRDDDREIQNYIHGDKNGWISYPVTSHRMKRTFWPFTSLFGYDYDYYPPPPSPGFGMFDSPFGGGFRPGFGGGGFGSGFGGGLGSGFGGPYGLPPPPSPFLGMNFAMGL